MAHSLKRLPSPLSLGQPPPLHSPMTVHCDLLPCASTGWYSEPSKGMEWAEI